MLLNSKYIYLDNNSTTPIHPRVFEEMIPYFKEEFANPNSNHHFGKKINEKVNEARKQIAEFINADPNELIFTSGATEAINLAIKGVSENYNFKGKHIVTVSTEHKAVIDTCRTLERRGFDVTYLPVHRDGLIDLKKLEQSIRPDTILVSVMYVNNETGVIQPIKEIALLSHQQRALFMIDATQAVGKIEINVDEIGVDLLCFSGHKMYAPKGIGALFIRKRSHKVKLTSQISGGGHEQGLRSGTLNVPGIIALARACEIASQEMRENQSKIAGLRDKLELELLKLPNTAINGNLKHRIYNTTNICFKGQDANILIGRMKDIAVSNGSACSSAVVEPSHVLKSMGLSDDDAFASIRFSLGRFNTLEEVETVCRTFTNLLT